MLDRTEGKIQFKLRQGEDICEMGLAFMLEKEGPWRQKEENYIKKNKKKKRNPKYFSHVCMTK